jgi:type I restriction enzyme, S subunit
MKKGWERKTIGDVCEFQRGLTYAKKDEVDISDNVVLRATNIDLTTNLLTFDELKYISDKVLVPDSKKVKRGSLMICTASGSKRHLGKVAFIDDDYDYAFGGFMGMLTPLNELLPKYLFHLMTSEDYKDFIGTLSDGVNINNLKFDDLRRFPIPVPPLAEQRRIVGILDEAFAGLATAQAHAEKNLQNARALFESHLNEVFSKKGEGWVEKRLEEVSTTFGRGKSKHRPRNAPHLYGGKYPFVQTGDIRNTDHIITEYSQTYSEAGLAQSKLWPKGTICITIAANIAETAILGFDACFPDSVIGMVANPKEAAVGFIEYLLQSFKARIQAMGKGSAQANINMGTFEHERFPFPAVADQRRIVARLDALSAETRRLAAIYERKLSALGALKKSLLHRAFAGEL